MKRLLPLMALCLIGCVTAIEKMDKGTPTGDHYVWIHSQWGAQATWKNSMGSSGAADAVKSFADAAQALVSVKGFDMTTKIALAQEVTKRVEAGEITKQMGMKLQAAIATAESEAGLKIALAEIAKQP